MTTTRQEVYPSRPRGPAPAGHEAREAIAIDAETSPADASWGTEQAALATAIPPLRKAAIVLVSMEQSLASQLLSHMDRTAVEAVTWEIARLERVDPVERAAVLEEFYGQGLRRLCFVFDDLVKMSDSDIRAAFHDEDVETWALALAGAAAPVRAKVRRALSALPSNRLNQYLDHLGPFRLSDSEAAQFECAERLRRLYDQGRISLPEPSGRDDVIV
jgi:flagellar motor switch protein FliG